MREAARPLCRASSLMLNMPWPTVLDIKAHFKLSVRDHQGGTTAMSLFEPLRLPNGAVIPNRVAKAAMEENLADADHAPSAALVRLYQTWADGGPGLIITGNVMIDRHALTGPGGVVLENDTQLE